MRLGLLSLYLLLCFCTPEQSFAQDSRFVDSTAAFGIDYSFGIGLDYQYGLVSFNSGVSLCDFNDDGIDDLAFGSVQGDSLYIYQNDLNDFVPLAVSSLASDTALHSFFTWVDYDNDGDKDIFLGIIEGSNKLYRNDGGLTFTDVTQSAGIGIDTTYTYSAAWGDYDRDGWLDCYIVNRDMRATFMGLAVDSPNYLFHNNGDGTFSDVSEAAGVSNPSGLGYGVVFVDYNKDDWPDLYVGNDKDTCNKLYKNMGDGTFLDVSEPNSTGRCISAMGIGVGDYDLNGYLDFYVTNGPGGNIFLRNNGDETFDEISESLGIQVKHNGWGTSFEDFDNDGNEDLFAVNGGSSILAWQRSYLFYNQGDNTFVEDTTDQITLPTYHSYGSSMGDWNDDGYWDIAVMNTGGDPLKLWQNIGGTNHWIKMHLEGVLSNKDGIGTWIEVWTNGQKQVRYTSNGDSYSSQFSENYIVGLGETTMVDSIILKWPSGVINQWTNLAADQTYILVEDPENSTSDCTTVYYPDQDGDGYGDSNATGNLACAPVSGTVTNNQDCDDTNFFINPDSPEACDGVDNNCNGQADEGITTYSFYRDADEDGYGDPGNILDTCLNFALPGYVLNDLDCDDTSNVFNPDASEICDGIDNNCNQLVDDNLPVYTYYRDVDNDGYGDPAAALDTCISAAIAGYVTNDLDCQDGDESINPDGTEIPNNDIDEDCNGEDLIVATEHLTAALPIRIFPNPVTDILYLNYRSERELHLRLYDGCHRLVQRRSLSALQQEALLELNALPSGVYWLVVMDPLSGAYYSEKVVRR